MVRTIRIIIAAILVFAYCLVTIAWSVGAFIQQSQRLEIIGYGSVAVGLVMATIGLVSAYGIWQNQRWGKIAAIVVLTLNALTALPGILFTTTIVERLLPLSAVLIAVIVVALLLWPAPQSSTA